MTLDRTQQGTKHNVKQPTAPAFNTKCKGVSIVMKQDRLQVQTEKEHIVPMGKQMRRG